MIQACNLSKAYGRQIIFDDVTFTVNNGERIGLAGRNGHGKTTLFRMILGEEHPDEGAIRIPSGYRIGHLSQHISFSRPMILAEACLGMPTADDGTDMSYKAKAVLLGLGFGEDDFNRQPLDMSGGFQVRLSLAKVLLMEPDLLLLDEPTNYLDILSIRWLRNFLRSWKRELMIITHDRDFMNSVTTHTMGIHRSKVRKVEGPTEKLFQQLLMEEEVYERTRQNDEKKRQETEQFIARFRYKATKARAVQSRIKSLERKERLEALEEIDTLDFSFPYEPFTGKWMLKAEDLVFSYDPVSGPLIEGLSITVAPGDRIAIIGKNGRGKTTLLNLLAGELSPQKGDVLHNPKTRLGYFGQTNIDRLTPANTVEEEIMAVMPDANRRAARTVCGIMMFEGDLALKRISVLSGGERSRVLLGKLLSRPSNMLLLDEPTNHLDMESVDSLVEALEAFDGAVIIVTHSEMILRALATRLVVFDGDAVSVFEGGYEDFLGRVGWQGEAAEDGQKDAASRPRTPQRRENRRQRAELVTERGRVLGGIQKRIEAAESEIMTLERRIETDTSALVKASEKSEWQAIAGLSKSVHEAKERIEALFLELETLTTEHVARARDFEERLTSIDQE